MWLRVPVPDFATASAESRVMRRYAVEGEFIAGGARLLDLVVDLSGGVLRDCPPVSICRIVLREAAWLRKLAPLGSVDARCPLALLSSLADTPPGTAARDARTTVAVILYHEDWSDWGASS